MTRSWSPDCAASAAPQQHLLELVRGFGDQGVDFIVLEQGIDTSMPGGRLVFHFLAALAEYDRE